MGTYRAYNKYDFSCLVGTDIVIKTAAATPPTYNTKETDI